MLPPSETMQAPPAVTSAAQQLLDPMLNEVPNLLVKWNECINSQAGRHRPPPRQWLGCGRAPWQDAGCVKCCFPRLFLPVPLSCCCGCCVTWVRQAEARAEDEGCCRLSQAFVYPKRLR